jgi:hypothetical protein
LSEYNLAIAGADEKAKGFGFGVNAIYAKIAKKGNTQYGRLLLIAWYLMQ